MTDLLLINPYLFPPEKLRERYGKHLPWIRGGNMYVHPFEPPLGLASLIAYVKVRGASCRLVDMQGEGMGLQELKEVLLRERPALVGITAMSPTIKQSLEVAALVKETLTETKVILGGVHPTVEPETLLEDRRIDFLVRGEGEKALMQILLAERNGGLAPEDEPSGEKTAKLIEVPPVSHLDELPMPDYSSLPVQVYSEYNQHLRGMKAISMLVSRGCPFHCSFCAVKATMGRRWRAKDPKKVVEEMAHLKEAYGLEGIWFKDSIFNLNPSWTRQFCHALKEKGLNISWQCNTRVDLLREDELRLMKEAGLEQIDLGIEAGTTKSLQTLRKGITPEQIIEAVKVAKRYVKVAGFFMIGIPGEKREDIEATYSLARSLKLDKCSFSLFIPLPGSELYDRLKAQRKIGEDELELAHFTRARRSYCDLSLEELQSTYDRINADLSR